MPKNYVENPPKIAIQPELFPVLYEDLQVTRWGDKVSVFCRGFCFCTFEMSDLFSRNYCIVQLHVSGEIKLSRLAKLFGVGYQHCSNILQNYKRDGIDGLIEKIEKRFLNRRLIDDEVGEFILGLRSSGKKYGEICEAIQFRFKKKIQEQSIRAWMFREKNQLTKGETFFQPELFDSCWNSLPDEDGWKWNKYAGSFLLYGAIEWSGFLRPFDEHIVDRERKRGSSWGVRRVLLTLFFLHALRGRSIEQTKHLVGDDFRMLVGGNFLKQQWLRYGVDGIVTEQGFNKAIEGFYRNMVEMMDKGDGIYYTDGHFSSYYGKRDVPKGYDPRRQMGFKGRNTVFLHNSKGEVVYLFESPTNTSLSNDIEILIADSGEFGMQWKRKTLIFDRGGYSQKCFKYLSKKKEMYFVTYLKHRKKEKQVAEDLFKEYEVTAEDGRVVKYKLFEKAIRETRYGSVRIIVLLAEDGRQIPIITNNLEIKIEEAVYFLQRRWREENCFKYMIEHFGIDLLTTYKVEEAPDKIIKRVNPSRSEVNHAVNQKKIELQKLRSELAQKIPEEGKRSQETIAQFMETERELKWKIKNVEVDLDYLKMKRETIPSKIEINLKDEAVIITQKRRLLVNAIKAMNYNAEKWLQSEFKKVHIKQDETLSIIRALWNQPGQVRILDQRIEVKLQKFDSAVMQASLDKVLESLKENSRLKMPDGKWLRIA
jgi:transposase